MSPDLALRSACVAAEAFHTERRLHRRYPIELDLRYRTSDGRKAVMEGVGKTRDLSKRGIHFDADQLLPKGVGLELWMDWPLRLHGVCALQLTVTGKVVRSSESGAAVQITRYEFRTRGVRPARQ